MAQLLERHSWLTGSEGPAGLAATVPLPFSSAVSRWVSVASAHPPPPHPISMEIHTFPAHQSQRQRREGEVGGGRGGGGSAAPVLQSQCLLTDPLPVELGKVWGS